ncbi:response regulator [Chondrinema litorale]|uniref:response regulator n=1 Tax=Chondrinema litorale TaxID=2994555 RepID=UPI002543C8A3|nr:response regulator [Chondrinema litorale]UZR99228.1 response regulator [Chondrinema litorale]
MINKILLIDDDDIFRLTASKILKKVYPQLEIFSAKNGEEALNQLIEKPIDLDLILLDINMPIMNGWEFLDAYASKEFKNEIPIYVLSSSIDPNDKEKADNNPKVIGFIEKPLSFAKAKQLNTAS